MHKLIPLKKDSRWFLAGASLGLLSFITYFLAYTRVLRADPANLNIFGVLLFFLIAAELFALLGFLGLHWLAIIASAGMLGSLISVIASFARPLAGWEELISILMMLAIIALGLVLGVMVELGLLIIRKIKARKRTTS
jgi:uncharacterized membrane protein YjjP (DUF1212 family)